MKKKNKKNKKNNVRLSGYTKIREWFLENDQPISENAFALGKGLPKNENGNFDFPSKSL